MEIIDDFNGFDSIFSLVFTIFIIVFILVIGYYLINFILNVTADKITVDATLISKDSRTNHHNHEGASSSSTSYSLTFETIYGERVVLDVSYKTSRQYAIGDFGEMTYQRKWLKSFNLRKK